VKYELPDNLVFGKPFTAQSVIKGHAEKDGKRFLHGPIAPDEEDYDTDIFTQVGLEKGLPTFIKLAGNTDHGHVDWAHQWRKTKDPGFIIAKGRPFTGPDGRPWLSDELAPKGTKPCADACWTHVVEAQMHAAHSLEGLCKARDPHDKRKIIETEIHLITIDPQPKGFGNFLKVGAPESLQQIAKGILADYERGDLGDSGWIPMPHDLAIEAVPAFFGDEAFAKSMIEALQWPKRFWAGGIGTVLESPPASETPAPATDATAKAFTTGSDAAVEGTTGGSADRKQALLGAEQPRCAGCRAKNRPGRARCRKCDRSLAATKAHDTPAQSPRPRRVRAALVLQKSVVTPIDYRCLECGRRNAASRANCSQCGQVL
jgi:hypothetical protein